METPASLPPWQPITFGGVAAFSRASFGRLLLVQFIVAVLYAASVLCFLVSTWFPAVQKAIGRLPERGAIRRGQLEWNSPSPVWLSERPFLLVGAVAGVVIGLLAGWLGLAALYSLPLRLIAFYSDRKATWGACWRVAGAAQLPGALLMGCATFLYGFNRINLVGLLFAWLLHLVIGWIYIGMAPARLPRLAGGPRRGGNPFGGERKGQ